MLIAYFHMLFLGHTSIPFAQKKKKPTTAHASLFRPVVISLSRIALNKGTKRTTLVKQQEGMPAVWPKETYDFSLIELQR